MSRRRLELGLVSFVVLLVAQALQADDQIPTPTDSAPVIPADLDESQGLKRLLENQELWVDLKRKWVVVDGQVCLREGQLELFACSRGTKEHEAVVSVNAKPRFIHAALMAIGAETGTPVKFDPEYTPAKGPVVDVIVQWVDKDEKKQRVRAQDWVKHVKSGKSMSYNWVFTGSSFWTNDDGQRFYQADSGDFICVSNFSTAMLDIPVSSTQDNNDLLFTAFADRIPPKGTKVRLILIPRLKKLAADAPKPVEPEKK